MISLEKVYPLALITRERERVWPLLICGPLAIYSYYSMRWQDSIPKSINLSLIFTAVFSPPIDLSPFSRQRTSYSYWVVSFMRQLWVLDHIPNSEGGESSSFVHLKENVKITPSIIPSTKFKRKSKKMTDFLWKTVEAETLPVVAKNVGRSGKYKLEDGLIIGKSRSQSKSLVSRKLGRLGVSWKSSLVEKPHVIPDNQTMSGLR